MGTVWMTSDHHFGHRAIIDFESRPFADAQEMDEAMIARWNETVAPDDTVFHLGDFSFLDLDRTREIVARLHGVKTLIMGNHDRERIRGWWLEAGFEQVSEYPIVYGGFYLLSHEPMYMNKHMPYLNVHGHIHGQKFAGKSYFNVSVEHWNYCPIRFEDIRRSVVSGDEQ